MSPARKPLPKEFHIQAMRKIGDSKEFEGVGADTLLGVGWEYHVDVNLEPRENFDALMQAKGEGLGVGEAGWAESESAAQAQEEGAKREEFHYTQENYQRWLEVSASGWAGKAAEGYTIQPKEKPPETEEELKKVEESITDCFGKCIKNPLYEGKPLITPTEITPAPQVSFDETGWTDILNQARAVLSIQQAAGKEDRLVMHPGGKHYFLTPNEIYHVEGGIAHKTTYHEFFKDLAGSPKTQKTLWQLAQKELSEISEKVIIPTGIIPPSIPAEEYRADLLVLADLTRTQGATAPTSEAEINRLMQKYKKNREQILRDVPRLPSEIFALPKPAPPKPIPRLIIPIPTPEQLAHEADLQADLRSLAQIVRAQGRTSNAAWDAAGILATKYKMSRGEILNRVPLKPSEVFIPPKPAPPVIAMARPKKKPEISPEELAEQAARRAKKVAEEYAKVSAEVTTAVQGVAYGDAVQVVAKKFYDPVIQPCYASCSTLQYAVHALVHLYKKENNTVIGDVHAALDKLYGKVRCTPAAAKPPSTIISDEDLIRLASSIKVPVCAIPPQVSTVSVEEMEREITALKVPPSTMVEAVPRVSETKIETRVKELRVHGEATGRAGEALRVKARETGAAIQPAITLPMTRGRAPIDLPPTEAAAWLEIRRQGELRRMGAQKPLVARAVRGAQIMVCPTTNATECKEYLWNRAVDVLRVKGVELNIPNATNLKKMALIDAIMKKQFPQGAS